ncbi:MAG: efflux RND transporter periplasmic adaptor subunit [Bacteroidetes bacterium]|nr:efflux RND transporter periplasmic adaptor subunit [Bacteroidota bacterium]
MKKIFFTVLIFSLVAACSSDKKAKLEKLKEKQAELKAEISKLESDIASEGGIVETGKVKEVGVTAVTPEVFKHFIEVQGRVDGDENITVSSKMPGVVSKIYVKEGDEVSEGQLLAELDNSVLIQSMEEVKTALDFSTNLYNKQKSLWEQKIGTEVQYLSAKNNKESLEKKLATLNEQLDMSKLKSPISGAVDAIDIKIGQSLMPGMPSIRVVNFNNLKVKAEVAETYASKVKKGNDALIFFPDLNKEISSRISYSAKVINNTTRTFTAEATLSTDKQEYHPNMIVVLKIIDYQKDSAIVIPVNLIQRTESAQFVYVAINQGGKNIAQKKEIKTGQICNGKAEIISGLSAKDKLITAAYFDVTDGMIIKMSGL